MANIAAKIAQIRAAILGKDVRESIASSIESINSEVVSTTSKETSLEISQNTLRTQFDDEVINMTLADPSSAEIVAGRTSNFTAKTFDTVGHRADDVDAQLADYVSMSQFPKIGAEIDDTARFQRAIDSFIGNIAGTIQISGDLRISSQVTCNKTGLRLQGISNKKSRIISNFSGIALFIKPLLNGNPYTSISYCKFYADNIAIVAEGDAITTGIGLWLQWIYASSFINIYTTGFAKHIVLKGSHLNNFFNLYQGNKNSTEATEEIHNRGIGLIGDGTLDEAGETTSNNNHVIGGWINNCSWDLTNLPGTTAEKIDIEPASNSIILGNDCIFKDCRFERFDLYAVQGLYDRFPWFIVSNKCKFKDNTYYQSGASQDAINPIFQINGDFNEIEISDTIPYNIGLISFSDTAKGNIIKYNAKYDDYQNALLNSIYKKESDSITYNDQQNRIIFQDKLQGTITDIIGSNTKAQGEFVCYSSRNINILGGDYASEQATTSIIDIPLPIGRIVDEITLENVSFAKITLTDSSNNRRYHLVGVNACLADEEGIYTLSATVYIPSTSSVGLHICPVLNTGTYVNARNKWITIRSRVYLSIGEQIIPTFQMFGVTGDTFYVGEISVCKGNCSVYIPNSIYNGTTSTSF